MNKFTFKEWCQLAMPHSQLDQSGLPLEETRQLARKMYLGLEARMPCVKAGEFSLVIKWIPSYIDTVYNNEKSVYEIFGNDVRSCVSDIFQKIL